MHKTLKNNIYFLALLVLTSILILISTSKQGSTLAEIGLDTSQKPLVILIDNSGSMGRCAVVDDQNQCIVDREQPFRIDEVKDIVRQRITQISTSSSQIGLVEFGNWKSYGLDYSKRCEAVKPLILPEVGNQGELLSALQVIQANDDGVTPIGYAINAVVNDILRANKLLPAKILLLSDGNPNCVEEYKINLCDIVAGLSGRGIDLKIDIIGYKANGKDSELISCAEKYPSMVRYLGTLDTPEQLQEAFDKVKELSTNKGITWNCILKKVVLVVIWIIFMICLVLVLLIIINFFTHISWLQLDRIKLFTSSNHKNLMLLMAAMTALGTLGVTLLTGVPCD